MKCKCGRIPVLRFKKLAFSDAVKKGHQNRGNRDQEHQPYFCCSCWVPRKGGGCGYLHWPEATGSEIQEAFLAQRTEKVRKNLLSRGAPVSTAGAAAGKRYEGEEKAGFASPPRARPTLTAQQDLQDLEGCKCNMGGRSCKEELQGQHGQQGVQFNSCAGLVAPVGPADIHVRACVRACVCACVQIIGRNGQALGSWMNSVLR